MRSRVRDRIVNSILSSVVSRTLLFGEGYGSCSAVSNHNDLDVGWAVVGRTFQCHFVVGGFMEVNLLYLIWACPPFLIHGSVPVVMCNEFHDQWITYIRAMTIFYRRVTSVRLSWANFKIQRRKIKLLSTQSHH